MDVTLSNGITVTTYSPRPEFDPLTADNADLEKNGFPPRPADPVHLARWNKVMGSLKVKLNYITPTFEYNPDIVHGPRVKGTLTDGTEVSTNWSGAVVTPPAGYSFYWVNGDWVIPAVTAPASGEYYCASWIGIDGDGDVEGNGADEVCRVGIESQVSGSGQPGYYAWWEWYPGGSVKIPSFPVAPGDMVTLLLCTAGKGSTTAGAYFVNRTTGAATSFSFTAPQGGVLDGTVLFGGCAEWIVGTPQFNGQQSELADYGQVFFSDCFALAGNQAGATTTVYSDSGDNINLYTNLSNASTEVSAATLYPPNVVECEYVGTLP
jgi:hypothetical protein